ncbi:MAG: hypothetical protein M1450_05015 [Patescibacteria group bacterium]|nr:hypothetical protein [Patescibacteria group bacterium]
MVSRAETRGYQLCLGEEVYRVKPGAPVCIGSKGHDEYVQEGALVSRERIKKRYFRPTEPRYRYWTLSNLRTSVEIYEEVVSFTTNSKNVAPVKLKR